MSDVMTRERRPDASAVRVDDGTLRRDLLTLLRCPFCRGSFAFDACTRPRLGRAEFGLLRCGCSEFPVVDGIPIIQRGPVGMLEHTRARHETDSVPIARIVECLRDDRAEDALLKCLAVPALPARLESAVGWRLSHGELGRRAARALGERRLRNEILTRRDVVGARDVIEFYFLSGGPLEPALGHYFIRRFSQPRHLAALSLASTIPSEDKPILDIACGLGHLAHYLGSRPDPSPVVGMDMNFYHLWIARHWMAPSARYVCGDASDGLPFGDDAFAATICSDAFHLIPRRDRLVAEIARCAPNRMVVLTRIGNAAVMPNEGVEGTRADYLREIGASPIHCFDEPTLVKSYLRRMDPLALPAASPTALDESKWLSFAWNVQSERRRSIRSDALGPHAVGTLCVNPIYASTIDRQGDVRLHFEFPAIWYAYENHGMLAYHPRQAHVMRQQLEAISAGAVDDEMRKHVDSFVLIGVPGRFQRPGGSSDALGQDQVRSA
jgi:SAM-dependent methyltransferase